MSELPIETYFKNRLIAPNELINLNVLKFKVKNEYYQTMADFQKDVWILFENISNFNDVNNSSYVSYLFIEFQKILLDDEKK